MSFADRLSLAAAPVFAVMGLLTIFAPGDTAMLCAAARGNWSSGGMVPMYLLMALFHAPPWLRLAARVFSSQVESPDDAEIPVKNEIWTRSGST